MRTQELKISCIYTDRGEPIQNLLYSSFATFLKWELEKIAPVRDCHV